KRLRILGVPTAEELASLSAAAEEQVSQQRGDRPPASRSSEPAEYHRAGFLSPDKANLRQLEEMEAQLTQQLKQQQLELKQLSRVQHRPMSQLPSLS
ncbi:unnamed protein product, partial [Polarella glacialis]